jgi:ABC-2 type transport system permease protein
MQLYFEVALRAFRRATAYRSAYIAGLLTNAFFGMLRCFVLIALYRAAGSTTVVGGFTLHDALSYTWATQALISIGAGWIAQDLMLTIRSGDVVTDLMRPWSFWGYWLSRFLGERAFNFLVRGSLTYLLGVLYFGAEVPTPAAALAFGLAIALALLVAFAYFFLVNMTAFWLIDATGVLMIANIGMSFFSGFLVPLAFFPPWLAAVANVLPFQAITGLPVQIFLGQIGGADLIAVFALQLGWAVVLNVLALAVLRRAVRKVVVQGG